MDEPKISRAELSDQDFLIELRGRFSRKKWTIGDLVEVERRGFEILDGDLDIKKELEAQRDKMLASVREVLLPKLEANRRNISESLGSFFPDFNKISTTHPEIMALEIDSPQVKQLAIQQELLGVQSNSLVVLHEIRGGQKKTWFDWTLWTFAGVAMLASVISLMIAVLG